jgi:hypothetical protein
VTFSQNWECSSAETGKFFSLIFLNFAGACAQRGKRVVIINARRNFGRDLQNAMEKTALSHRKDAMGLDKASGITSASCKHLQRGFYHGRLSAGQGRLRVRHFECIDATTGRNQRRD